MRIQFDVGFAVICLVRIETGVEQRVHKSGLAKASFADTHDIEGETRGDGLVDQLVRQGIEADMTAKGQIPAFGSVRCSCLQIKIKNLRNLIGF